MRNTEVAGVVPPAVTIGIPAMPERARYLDHCLSAVVAQTYAESYEVIIAQHPGFQYSLASREIPGKVSVKLLESGVSLSRKRNDIMKQGKGEYVLYIDDDVMPEAEWLERMMLAAIEHGYDIFWGLAKPIYEKEFPESLDPFEMLIGGFHYDRRGRLRRKGLIGCNFGVKKGLRHRRGEFLESIGRGAMASENGEETLFVAECIEPLMGMVPDAVVRHFVQADRINFAYVVANTCANAKATVLINEVLGRSNADYTRSRLSAFFRAWIPNKHLVKGIALESRVLAATFMALASKHLRNGRQYRTWPEGGTG